ncbi:MAG TPA: PilZ domain-containing protein [Gemmataceae bacterium]|nr:PilZ domain-containing protein [Gemmataceae bacterium]
MSEMQTSVADRGKRPGIEQRKWVRHLCPPETRCQVAGASTGGRPLPVVVRNISIGGISLALRHPVPVGTLLDIHLNNANHRFTCDLQMQVVFSIGSPDGQFILGGSLNRELSEEELKKLV